MNNALIKASNAVRTRKLASIQRILDIQPIEGADKIVRVTINGWQVVSAIDNGFKVGDLVCYFEIDSFIPHEIAPFLSKGKEPSEFEGVKGERLRTVRLRKQISQGLIIPIPQSMIDCGAIEIAEGVDLTEHLGIKKWEKVLPACLNGQAKGNFPSYIHKTDQERCQNIPSEIKAAFESGEEFEITEKLDGSSITVYRNSEKIAEDDNYTSLSVVLGVCSRNFDLKLEQEGNTFVDTAKKSGLLDALAKYGRNIAVQGELYGEGIQGNNERIKGQQIAIFDIFDIDNQQYLSAKERYKVYADLQRLGYTGTHVPTLGISKLPTCEIPELLTYAERKNNAGRECEGVVFKSVTSSFTFKAISNKFLLKNEE